MRKLLLSIAAAAAVICTGSLANRAEAMTAGNPAGIRAALDDVAVTDQVHCVWRWRHHNWWRGRPHWDGCYRGRIYYGPRYYVWPRHYGHRIFRFRPRFHRHRVFRFRPRYHHHRAFAFRGGHVRHFHSHFRGHFRGGRRR